MRVTRLDRFPSPRRALPSSTYRQSAQRSCCTGTAWSPRKRTISISRDLEVDAFRHELDRRASATKSTKGANSQRSHEVHEIHKIPSEGLSRMDDENPHGVGQCFVDFMALSSSDPRRCFYDASPTATSRLDQLWLHVSLEDTMRRARRASKSPIPK